MSNIQMRFEIGKLLDIADEKLLASVFSMMKTYLEHDESIVGFTADGKPMTRADLLLAVETSRKEAKKTNVIGADVLLAEINNW